jgi:hypothetical protein
MAIVAPLRGPRIRSPRIYPSNLKAPRAESQGRRPPLDPHPARAVKRLAYGNGGGTPMVPVTALLASSITDTVSSSMLVT